MIMGDWVKSTGPDIKFFWTQNNVLILNENILPKIFEGLTSL